MSNTIKIKRGLGKPDSLEAGELAIDTDTGALYSLVGSVVTEINEPPEAIDLSDYINSTKKNDVIEGSFQIAWDDSADPYYPFNGRIGYNKNSEDPNSLDGSFLYVSGNRGTFSIGRDGDVELHGPSEILGIADRLTGERPWITGFSYVQASDFLDADGNSIIGNAGGGGSPGIPDAPADGRLYARQNAAWTMVVTYDGTTVEANLAAEIQARIAGDAELQGDLANEGAARIEADESLQGQIDSLPPAPVDSVNGKTGVVVLSAADVGALPDSYDPGINYPVTSVNAKTGAVTLTHTDVGAQVAGSYQPAGDYAAVGASYTKAESDSKWQPKGSYQPAGNYALVGASYSKAESDSAYQAKGSYAASNHNHSGVYQPVGSYALSNHNHSGVYQPAGSYAASNHSHNYAAVGASYTKAESDNKYELKGQGGGGNFVPLSGNSTISGTLTATDFVASSDLRLKTNVKQVPAGMLAGIQAREWDWTDTGRKSVGVIAQDLEAAGLDHLVHEDDSGYKAVAYNGLIGYLIAEVNALRDELEELKK